MRISDAEGGPSVGYIKRDLAVHSVVRVIGNGLNMESQLYNGT